MFQIDAKQFNERLQSGTPINILDVREPIEYHSFNIGGQNIPVNKLKDSIDNIGYNKTNEIIVICSAGIRSEAACEILDANGFKNAVNLKGGLIALQREKNQ
ncbi:rhodanese-like domain-containing protein [Mucilaginibacter conchicola]|uniref:Rhodanese-like domain-containing protein n=1 Tax=Mucilaginibacter conchicola TaxID=2303333 RepID=A0A372NX68_9SPHI|nr:rhodanese-like domain-containing protein [Mucilaginibacter conchicola]RFZ94622.1 rhodanese-like domain-containing protein [Mucilaginibacter conchicola]